MTSLNEIDARLSRALLLEDPDIPDDVVGHDDTAYPDDDLEQLLWTERDPDVEDEATEADLRSLCTTVITHTAASSLRQFITDTLPAPQGARVLGCVLQLTDAEDSARFWWQYAAAAGDHTACFLLHLHHTARGEPFAATWWLHQTTIDTSPSPHTTVLPRNGQSDNRFHTDAGISTLLRILSRLPDPDSPPARTEVFTAVMRYIPDAVAAGRATNPEAEIPLPQGFADNLGIVLAAATATDTMSPPGAQQPPGVLVGEWLDVGATAQRALISIPSAREAEAAWTANRPPTIRAHKIVPCHRIWIICPRSRIPGSRGVVGPPRPVTTAGVHLRRIPSTP
jgi:hypothetical protein